MTWAFCDAITVHRPAEFEEREATWQDGYRGQDRFDFFNGALDDVVGKYWKVCDVHRARRSSRRMRIQFLVPSTCLVTQHKSFVAQYQAQVIRVEVA